MKLTTTLLAAFVLLTGVQDLQKAPEQVSDADKAVIAAQRPTYPLEACPVSGDDLDDEALDIVSEGRLIRVCCKACIKSVKQDTAALVAKIDAAVVKAQTAAYPMTVCPISGEALGSMGDPIDRVHGTRLVRLCCKGCNKGFDKDPTQALAALDAAYIAKQIPTYALKECPVSGEALGSMGDPIDKLYGNTLVRLCCKGCIKSFDKDPAKYAAALMPAREHSKGEHAEREHGKGDGKGEGKGKGEHGKGQGQGQGK